MTVTPRSSTRRRSSESSIVPPSATDRSGSARLPASFELREETTQDHVRTAIEGRARLQQQIGRRGVVPMRLDHHGRAGSRRHEERLEHPGDGGQRADQEEAIVRAQVSGFEEASGGGIEALDGVDDALGPGRGSGREQHHTRGVERAVHSTVTVSRRGRLGRVEPRETRTRELARRWLQGRSPLAAPPAGRRRRTRPVPP